MDSENNYLQKLFIDEVKPALKRHTVVFEGDAAEAYNRGYADGEDDAENYADAKDKVILSSAKAYANTHDEETLDAAKAYANTHDEETLDTAKAYANTHDEETLDTAKAYADDQVAEAEKKTKDYIDGLSGSFVKKIKNNVDGSDHLNKLYRVYVEPWVDKNTGEKGSSTSYKLAQSAAPATIPLRSDVGALTVRDNPDKKNEAVPKQYVDDHDAITLSSANNYADGKASTAESNAKNYADGKASTAESNAKNYANSKASTAETNAKEYATAASKKRLPKVERLRGHDAVYVLKNGDTPEDTYYSVEFSDFYSGYVKTNKVINPPSKLTEWLGYVTQGSTNLQIYKYTEDGEERLCCIVEESAYTAIPLTSQATSNAAVQRVESGDIYVPTEDGEESSYAASTKDVNSKVEAALKEAKDYADGLVISAGGVTKGYVDEGDATTLASAKKYVDDKGYATTAYADQAEADALSAAKTYADGKASTAESNAISAAKEYANQHFAGMLEQTAEALFGEVDRRGYATTQYVDEVAKPALTPLTDGIDITFTLDGTTSPTIDVSTVGGLVDGLYAVSWIRCNSSGEYDQYSDRMTCIFWYASGAAFSAILSHVGATSAANNAEHVCLTKSQFSKNMTLRKTSWESGVLYQDLHIPTKGIYTMKFNLLLGY